MQKDRQPVDTPIVDANGFVSQRWRDFFAGWARETPPFPEPIVPPPPALLTGLWAARGGITAVDGTLFAPSDQRLFYVRRGGAWVYQSGLYHASTADPPAGLGANDAELLWEVTDVNHLLRWTGIAFTWGPGDVGSGGYVIFPSDPGLGWMLPDGVASGEQLMSDGSHATVIPSAQEPPAPTVGHFYYRL